MLQFKRTQSVLEYTILIAVVIAAIVVMQVYVKRGMSGRLKDSSDRLAGGESFSPNSTTTWERTGGVASDPRVINDLTKIDKNAVDYANKLIPGQDYVKDITSQNPVYSASVSSGGSSTSNSLMATDDASHEAFRVNELKK